jgi:class 3 adenylate cyclase/pimeloyl-ACP methyl ester carboxylesterase
MAEPAGQRQLLAILFTDVVGYTGLTERDEAAAVRVRDRHRERVREQVAAHGGELVDAPGDETLSVFSSALAAVDCALALQAALRDDAELRLRIGIHLGDVLRRGSEVIGEGVNVAARIRPLAEAGGICVSEPVWQMVRNRTDIRGQALGPRSLKNVTLPVTVYALRGRERADAPARGRRGRRRWLVAAGVVFVLAGIGFAGRVAIATWLSLNLPRAFGNPLEQQIGFATTSDGVRIAYATSGRGPPLVFVLGWFTHLTEGLGSPLYDSAGALRWHSREHLLVRYDGRGFGLSDRDVTDFSLDARVRDVEAVVEALGLKRFALVAASAGGPTAVTYVDRHPERVTHLVLAGTYLAWADRGEDLERAWIGIAAMARTSWDAPAARAALVELEVPGASAIERRLLMHFMGVSAHGSALAGFFEVSRGIDVSEQAHRIRVPTLVVAGSEDAVIPVSASRALAAAIPGARFEILEGANHLEASALDPRLMRMVSEFLRQPSQTDE